MSTCLQCSKLITSPHGKKFCTQSCAARYNNTRRPTRTPESKQKTAIATHNRHITTPKPQYTAISQCVWCHKWFPGKRRTCSNACCRAHKSNYQSTRLKTDSEYRRKLGTGHKSFMEASFEGWVQANYPHLPMSTQHPFRNNKQHGYFYADFYFPTLHLVIELDGTQHNTPDNQAYDAQRDHHLLNCHGVNVVRITSREYRQQLRVDEIRQLLSTLC